MTRLTKRAAAELSFRTGRDEHRGGENVPRLGFALASLSFLEALPTRRGPTICRSHSVSEPRVTVQHFEAGLSNFLYN